jgi:Tol biopolymer transport system component
MIDSRNIKVITLILLIITFLYSGCQEQADTPSPGQIADYTQIDFDPAWTVSGSKIAYAHSNTDHELSGIYSVNPDGNNVTQLISGIAVNPDWSPDESRIVFSQFNDLYICSYTGDSIVRLTFGSISNDPEWSYSGDLIAYNRSNSVSMSDIFVIRPDGSGETFIDSNGKYPSWVTGDTSIIYFKQINEGEYNSQIGDSLVQYFFKTGSINTIAVLSGDEYKYNSYPNMTDNGIIFCSKNKSGYSYIYKIDLNGQNIIRLTESQGYSPDFCLTNYKIAYTNRSRGNGRLWIMDQNGTNKTQLTY